MTRNVPSPNSAGSGGTQTAIRLFISYRRAESPAVTIALRRAYSYLSSPHVDRSRYLMAQACLRPLLQVSMSHTQRMHVAYALAKSFLGMDESDQAVDYADEAVDLAQQLSDQAALITLLHFRGGLFRTLGLLQQSAQDYTECVALIRTSTAGVHLRDSSMELDVVGRLAGLELYLARYDRAQQCLVEGRSMTSAQHESPVARATLEWTQALIHRWLGLPEQGLQHSLYALDAYSTGDYPLSESRLRVAIAEIALDVTKKLPRGTSRDRMLEFVEKHLAAALALSVEHQDVTGQCLVELARIRMSQLARHVENRISSIERVQQTSQRLHDNALLAQSYTLLAEEFVEQHDVLSAQEFYRQAVCLAEASAAPALSVWARQGLHDSERIDIHG